jgi:hypothetical protein
MELFRNNSWTPDLVSPRTIRALYWLLPLLSLVPLAIVLPAAPTGVGIAILVGWIALIWVAITFVRGQFHYVALLWVAIYPYCYYLFSYPVERSIFTVDRAFIILLVIEMLVVSRRAFVAPLASDIRISAYFWALYLLICFLSLALHPLSEVMNSYRLLVDSMLMPAIFGLYAVRYFPLPQDLRKLHVSACILGIGLCLTGLVELTTNIDLFPWKGSEPQITDTHLRRADGPFEQQIVLSMVGLLCLFFVIYLRRVMPQEVSPGRALLHKAGCIASLGAALLPMNRGTIVVLVPIAVIDCCSRQRLISRKRWIAFFAVVVLAGLTAKLLDPRLYDDRVARPDNLYQRLAQHRETLGVVREYPFFGVGFNLYHDVASRNPQYMATWKGIQSMNIPHNALMIVLSEEGIVGFVLYLLAQAFLIRAMWRIRKIYPPGWLAFLYCLLSYVLTGLDYGTAYFFDINLFYIFVLGVLLQLQTRMVRENQFAVLAAS